MYVCAEMLAEARIGCGGPGSGLADGVSLLKCALGTKLSSFGRAARSLKHRPVFRALSFVPLFSFSFLEQSLM